MTHRGRGPKPLPRMAGRRGLVGSMLFLSLIACGGKMPVLTSTLQPCPDSPNCVYSRATDDRHGIAPLAFDGDPADAWATLGDVIEDMPRTEVIVDEPTYRHVVFSTALWGFEDDVQFVLSAEDSAIHFRSASRIGKSDLGKNRNRMESIREGFAARR